MVEHQRGYSLPLQVERREFGSAIVDDFGLFFLGLV